ncbi:MAG: MlaD family protein [Mariprofundaceae bacterium]
MKRQVGWFVMLGIGGLVLLLLIVSVRSNVFAKKFYLYVSPPSASSFYVGQPVKFQGFAIGGVDKIELLHEGDVRITLRLLERYRHMLHQGAIVKTTKEGLIGEQIVEVTAGEADRPIVNDKVILAYESEASLDQLLIDMKPAVANANILLKELSDLAKWMNNPDGDVRVAMASLRGLSSGFQGEELKVVVVEFGRALKELQVLVSTMGKQKVMQNFSKSLQSMTQVMDGIQPLSEALGKDGAKTVEQMALLMKQVNTLSKALSIVASDLSELTPELPALARESRTAIEQMKTLLQGLENSWLLGGSRQQKRVDDMAVPPALDMRP